MEISPITVLRCRSLTKPLELIEHQSFSCNIVTTLGRSAFIVIQLPVLSDSQIDGIIEDAQTVTHGVLPAYLKWLKIGLKRFVTRVTQPYFDYLLDTTTSIHDFIPMVEFRW